MIGRNPQLERNAVGAINERFAVVPLKEFVFFQEGPGLRKWQWTDSGMKVINVTNILPNGQIDISNTKRYISKEEFERKYSHFEIDAGDVVVASSGNTYGKVGRIHQSDLPLMMNTSVIRLRPIDQKLVVPEYLYAFLRSDFFRSQIEQYVVGSAQPNFGPTHLALMQLILPPIEDQRRISDIISAFDSLIENNTRRIEIFEEMARRLYEEWFVHPPSIDGQNEGLIDTSSGRLPKGWRLSRVAEVAEYINRGIAPTYAESGPTTAINQKCIRDQRLDLTAARRQERPVSPDKMVRLHDILINSTGVGTLGRVAQVWSDLNNVTVDTHVTILRPSAEVDPYFLGAAAFALQPFFEEQGVGSTSQTELSRERIGQAQIVVPPRSLQEQFGRTIGPQRKLCVFLAQQNANLRLQRELILPKLISGEIDFTAAATALPIAAE